MSFTVLSFPQSRFWHYLAPLLQGTWQAKMLRTMMMIIQYDPDHRPMRRQSEFLHVLTSGKRMRRTRHRASILLMVNNGIDKKRSRRHSVDNWFSSSLSQRRRSGNWHWFLFVFRKRWANCNDQHLWQNPLGLTYQEKNAAQKQIDRDILVRQVCLRSRWESNPRDRRMSAVVILRRWFDWHESVWSHPIKVIEGEINFIDRLFSFDHVTVTSEMSFQFDYLS